MGEKESGLSCLKVWCCWCCSCFSWWVSFLFIIRFWLGEEGGMSRESMERSVKEGSLFVGFLCLVREIANGIPSLRGGLTWKGEAEVRDEDEERVKFTVGRVWVK
ncbi:hypothetical protein AAC387_Pa10g1134 [Persea americana]